MHRFALVLALLGLLAPPLHADEAAAEAQEAYEKALKLARNIERSLVDAVEKVRENSVSVLNKRRHPQRPDDDPVLAGVGSGVIIRYKGKLWIVTNVHVIAGHAALEVVTHDGVVHPVDVVDQIATYDIALLKFSERVRTHRGVTIKASASDERNLNEGTWVIATGNPFFLALDGASVTTLGVVSGLERYLGGRYKYVGAIQHDAEVNPGNSGGPVWSLDGELLGINGMIMMGHRLPGAGPSNTGASFSLPVHQVAKFLKLLVDDKDAQAGTLAIQTQTQTDKRGRPSGARITQVSGRSPFNRGRRSDDTPTRGDVITRIICDGSSRRIYTATDLEMELSLYPAGTKIQVFFKREGRTRKWKGVLGAMQ